MIFKCLQQCKSTEATEDYTPVDEDADSDPHIATASADSEVHAAADAAKMGLHEKYFCEEIEIPVSKKIRIGIDAGAAMGFIENTGTVGRMKHIDLRSGWVDTLRNKDELEFYKVSGDENTADFFTKILHLIL